MQPGKQYLFKFASKATAGQVESVNYKIDVNTQEHSPGETLELNDIAVVDVTLSQEVAVDPYPQNRATGGFIVIDRLSNITVGAGMVVETLAGAKMTLSSSDVSEFEIELNALIRKHFPHWGAEIFQS